MPLSLPVAPSRRTRAALSVPAVLLAIATVAGCGGGSGSAAAGTAAAGTAAATSAAGGSPAAASGSPGARGASGFTAYLACLKQHGVTIPTRAPGTARPSGAPRSRGAGGFGGGFGGAFATSGPAAAAAKACVALRPTGGFGGGGLSNNAQLQSQLTAYRSCLSDHGVVLPTPAAQGSGAPAAGASAGAGRRGGGGFGGLGAINTADPKTAAAVKACAALRPTFGGGRGAGGAAVPTPST